MITINETSDAVTVTFWILRDTHNIFARQFANEFILII
jgi:hypothetical protein